MADFSIQPFMDARTYKALSSAKATVFEQVKDQNLPQKS
jgi:hypothetical protein